MVRPCLRVRLLDTRRLIESRSPWFSDNTELMQDWFRSDRDRVQKTTKNGKRKRESVNTADHKINPSTFGQKGIVIES